MKAIVVYYSMDGNSKYVADDIANQIGAETLRIEPVKDYPTGPVSKRFWGGKDLMFGTKVKLKPYQFDARKYDVIVIGTPNWTKTFAAPLRTFFDENDIGRKKTALYVCSGSGKSEGCFAKLKEAMPKADVIACLSLIYPKEKPSQEKEKKIKDFCDQIKEHMLG